MKELYKKGQLRRGTIVKIKNQGYALLIERDEEYFFQFIPEGSDDRGIEERWLVEYLPPDKLPKSLVLTKKGRIQQATIAGHKTYVKLAYNSGPWPSSLTDMSASISKHFPSKRDITDDYNDIF